MSKVNNDGKWVWNILPRDTGAPLKLSAGQLEVDSNGVHLCHGPGHSGGLIASFPLGTLVWREELSPVAAKAEAMPAQPEPLLVMGSTFLSSPVRDPLVDAIESLLGEQRAQLCGPVPARPV